MAWVRVSLAIATVVLVLSAVAGVVAARWGNKRAIWPWRVMGLIGIVALAVAVVLAVLDPRQLLLSSVAGRAALIALIAGLLGVISERRYWQRAGKGLPGWPALLPVAVVTGLAATSQRAGDLASAASLILVALLVTAGLSVWSLGRDLTALGSGGADNLRTAVITFAGLTINVIAVAGVSWRIWGTPLNTILDSTSLLAVWLVYAARMVLRCRSVRLVGAFDLIASVLLVGITLSLQWAWPFG